MSKAKAKTYKSEAMAAVHEIMEGLHDAGSIDKRTMREFDEACLAPAPVRAETVGRFAPKEGPACTTPPTPVMTR